MLEPGAKCACGKDAVRICEVDNGSPLVCGLPLCGTCTHVVHAEEHDRQAELLERVFTPYEGDVPEWQRGLVALCAHVANSPDPDFVKRLAGETWKRIPEEVLDSIGMKPEDVVAAA